MRVTSSLNAALTPTNVALGNFDGVHRGHQQVVKPILSSHAPKALTLPPDSYREGFQVDGSTWLEEPHETPENSPVGIAESPYATVLTFHPHPREFFSGQRRTLLTPLPEKVQHLESLGVEQLVLLPFDQELASLAPQQFVEKILVHQLRANRVSVGEDFRFGYQRVGTAADLKKIAAAYGITVTLVPLHTCDGERISSSVIRNSLLEGDLQQVNRLLGRPYTLLGSVVEGQQLGRTIGFPTANLQVPPEKFLPRQGVYCVRVSITQQSRPQLKQKDVSFSSPPNAFSLPGVMNIGVRPTVDGTAPTIEVHLLDWSGDLYGKTLRVSLEKFLRPEQKFSSLDALKAQIQADTEAAKAILGLRSED